MSQAVNHRFDCVSKALDTVYTLSLLGFVCTAPYDLRNEPSNAVFVARLMIGLVSVFLSDSTTLFHQ